MKTTSELEQEYAEMLVATDYPFCWYCGKGLLDRPSGWHGPWLVERAHIVNATRAKDRRAVILLCSLCHRLQHGARIACGRMMLPPLDLPGMLWLKRQYDPQFYDREFLRKHHGKLLPRSQKPRGLGR